MDGYVITVPTIKYELMFFSQLRRLDYLTTDKTAKLFTNMGDLVAYVREKGATILLIESLGDDVLRYHLQYMEG